MLTRPAGGAAAQPAQESAAADKPEVDPSTVESIVNRHPAVQEIQEQISELERSLSNHRRLTRSQSDPAIRRSLQELSATRQELDSVRQSVRQEVINQLAETASRGNARDAALAGWRVGPCEHAGRPVA